MGQTGENYDIWLEGLNRPNYPQLDKDLKTEIVVVGGGITGILNAYYLQRAGYRVALLEKGRLGEWTTDCTTAFLTAVIDTSYVDIIKIWGLEKAKLIYQSHEQAISEIENLIKEEKIACDFARVDLHLLARQKGEIAKLKREEEALRKLGAELVYEEGSGSVLPCVASLSVRQQATYQPISFLDQLAKLFVARGGLIFEQTEVVDLKKSSTGWQITTGKGFALNSPDVVVATYSPLGEPWHLYFKKALYRSYVYEFSVPQDSFPQGLYVDLVKPYHYFRIANNGGKQQIIWGGADHREDVPISRNLNYKALLKQAKDFFPTPIEPLRHWSGPILESIDGLPYIGKDKWTGLYQTFGFSGNGLTYASISAKLITNLMILKEGEEAPSLADIFRVNRWTSWRSMWVKGWDYAGILLGGAVRNWSSRL